MVNKKMKMLFTTVVLGTMLVLQLFAPSGVAKADEIMKGTHLPSVTTTLEQSPAGTWGKESGKWFYQNIASEKKQIGWVKDKGQWYFTNSNGFMQTGWVKNTNKWYYMNPSGVMQTGWIQAGGKWYYTDAGGVMQTGWVQANGKWYYTNASGIMQTNWTEVNGKWYFMNTSGAMQTGWVQVKGSWYYMNASGAMQTDWLDLNGKKYYLYNNGQMAVNTTIQGYSIAANGEATKMSGDLTEAQILAAERQVITLVNQERKRLGLSALQESADIMNTARLKSVDMWKHNYFDHTGPTYGKFQDMMNFFKINYSTAGENILYGSSTPEGAFNGWMNSKGHREAIQNPVYTHIGVGFVYIDGKSYWTQHFKKPW